MAQGLFEDQDIQGPGAAAAAPPQQATAPAPSIASGVASTLQTVAGSLDNLFTGYAASVKQKQAAQENSGVSLYARTVTGLNAAVEQGKMSQADAQRRLRTTYNQLVADNPAITDSLTKFNTSIAGSAGLGDTLAKGTDVEQQMHADTKSATAAGFIQPGMTQDQQADGLNRYRTQQHQLNQMDFYSKQLEITSKQASIAAAQESAANSRVQRANAAYDLNIKRNTQGVRMALADVASSYQQKAMAQMEQIRQDRAAGKITPEQALQQTQQIRNNYSNVTQSARGVAGGDYVDTLASPLFKSLDAFDGEMSGKVSADVSQHKLDQATTMAKLPFMQDPQSAKIIVGSQFFQNVPSNIMGTFGPEILKIIQGNGRAAGQPSNPVPDNPADVATNKTYFDGMKANIRKLTGKDPTVDDPQGLQQDLQLHFNQILKGVGSMGMSAENPKDFNNVVDFMSSPDFLAFQKHGGTVDEGNRSAALNVVRENYMNKVIPLLKNEWDTNKTVVGYPTQTKQYGAIQMPVPNEKSTTEAVTYKWTGKSLVFVPAKGMEGNRGAIAKARDLNSRVSPLVQKMVMMEAHMEGNDDYTKYFKEQESNIFGESKETTDGQ